MSTQKTKSPKSPKSPEFPPRYEYRGNKLTGGQGVVYVCCDQQLERLVAIKVINQAHSRSIREEVVSLRDIASVHLAAIYDAFPIEEGGFAIVQEYVSGDGLDEWAKSQCQAKVDDIFLKTLYQIACGIADVHEHGRIHRDIKPHNMRFDEGGIVKILDFGLSCLTEPAVRTICGRGTFGFRAPELYQAGTHVTNAVDVYAYGATAWFLATNDLPSELKSVPPRNGAPDFADMVAGIPREIADDINSSLLMEPQRRPCISAICNNLKRRLLYGRHRAELIVRANERYTLEQPGTHVRINASDIGAVTIGYNGLDFFIREITGDVYVNNSAVTLNGVLPGSCVLTLGAPALLYRRVFIPFNVSHPEVVL